MLEEPPPSAIRTPTREELIGTDPFALIHPDDVAAVRGLFEESLRRPGVNIPAEFRFRILGPDGKVRCPLPDHDDPRASLWIGETPEEGWFCFGCSRGGRIFDLASLLIGGPWGVDLRGDAFRAARAELERRLGVPIPGRS